MDFASADGEPGPSSRYSARANPFYTRPADDIEAEAGTSEPLFGSSSQEQDTLKQAETDSL
jgi:hypothetical protein